MMQNLSIREMREQLGNLDVLIKQERELIVTRHNKPVARILPVKENKQRPSHQALRDALPYQGISSEELQRLDREER